MVYQQDGLPDHRAWFSSINILQGSVATMRHASGVVGSVGLMIVLLQVSSRVCQRNNT